MAYLTLKSSLATFAATTVTALILTACSAQPGSGDGRASADAADARVVATVSGTPVYQRDVIDAARMIGQISGEDTLGPDDPAFSQILSEVIDQRLLSLNAKARGLDKTPEAKHRLVQAKERILANIAVGARIEDRVTPDAVRALYDQQIKLRQTGQEARASHILFETEKDAKAAAKRLKAGEDFAALATELSLDRGSQTSGGDLGYFQADAMVPSFSKVVFALEKGAVSDPFESQFGWHIAKLVDKRTAPPPSFEQMEAEMTNFLTMDEISKLLTELRDDAEIEIKDAPAPEITETPAAPGPDVAAEDMPAEDGASDEQ